MQIGFPPNYHYDAISYSSKAITSFLPNSIIQDLSFDSTFTLEEGSDCLQSSFISQSNYQNFPKPKQHQYSDCAMYRNKNEKNFAFNKGVIKPTKKKSERINQKMNMEYDFINFNMSFTNFLSNYGGMISSLMKKNIGSRYLQKMIDSISQNDINLFFYFTTNNLGELMCDQYANYFIQKILLKCNFTQRIFVYNKLNYEFLQIAKNISGTHCLQALIEGINSEQEEKILYTIIHLNLLDLSLDQNSTHLVQKIIEKLNENKRTYINKFIFNNFLKLCKNPNGICTIKAFITYNKDDFIKKKILEIISLNYYEITQDQFGNYAIQHIIETYGYFVCYSITRLICLNFVFFSTQKYSSNVIDKVLIAMHMHNHNEFVQLIKQMFFEDNNLFELLKSKYGTFVLTNCLKLLNENEQKVIKSFLKEKLNFNSEDNRTLFCRLRRLMQ